MSKGGFLGCAASSPCNFLAVFSPLLAFCNDFILIVDVASDIDAFHCVSAVSDALLQLRSKFQSCLVVRYVTLCAAYETERLFSPVNW